jgi:PEP-CTERM motif-containing protein
MTCKPGAFQAATLLIVLLVNCPIVSISLGGTVTTFDDISFWVGAGSNRSAIAIDWNGSSGTDQALVWGYRWDDAATGAKMLETIVAADSRLFAKINQPAGSSTLLYGLGYDAIGDGQFALDDATVFDTHGFAVTGPADNAASADESDYYAEGWFTGLWHYGHSTENVSPYNGGAWGSDGAGMAGRTLADGDWDSWTFTPTFDFGAFAENPCAAEAPLAADFDADGDTDGNDFLIWQRGHGILTGADSSDGDADGDTDVDADDLVAWQTRFGASAGAQGVFTSSLGAAIAVPEPTSLWLAGLALAGMAGNGRFHARYVNHYITGRFPTCHNRMAD